MTTLPDDFLNAIPPAAEASARRWWATLPDAERREVVALWDRRLEAHFFAPQVDEGGRPDAPDRIPSVRGGRFVPHDDAWGLAEWGPDYFEYLLDHPELYPIHDPTRGTPHIGCTRHREARACRDAGRVPADFACPVDAAACPLRPLRGAILVKASGPRTRPRSGRPS